MTTDTQRSGVSEMAAVASELPTSSDLLMALLCDVGGGSCSSMPTKCEGDRDWSGKWEWFDPFAVNPDDVDDLPEHWRLLLTSQNAECWRCGYRYVHAPEPILSQYPRVPVRGIFAVCNDGAMPETVKAGDLIHAGGQHTEHDTKDKGIWRGWLDSDE